MLKLRLKRIGRKGSPSYRLVIMENTCRRDGRPIEELGYYNPISNQYKFDTDKDKNWTPINIECDLPLDGISRIVIIPNGKKIAVVVNE